MDELARELDRAASLQVLLGYLNFSEGRPDPRFRKTLSDAFAVLNRHGIPAPWFLNLHRSLRARLAELQAEGTAAFRDARQADAVLTLALDRVLPAYRTHHADLLFHQGADDLFQPFFLARVFEVVLGLGPLREREEDIVAGALARLNDYVGYRPVAILETRPRGEPYDHERVCPIPLFLRGAGVAAGRYLDLVSGALKILNETEAGFLEEAGFDPAALDELAMDPRAYDHGHPVNKRPNYLFGEWDPHAIDNRGRYRRFVVRQLPLDALLDRVANPGEMDPADALYEAAAVMAGTTLMAAAVTGPSPDAHDSTVSLGAIIPRIAAGRDRFYAALLKTVPGLHGERLRREAAAVRQPFGGARQHLNQYLARHRAAQLQQRHLALLLAAMGYPDASRRHASRIPAASVRLLVEIHSRLATGQLLADAGDLTGAAAVLPAVEDLLHRGIACGALADPWNVLGFQAFFPLSPAPEDSVRDQRVDELIGTVDQTFHLYARLLSEAAATGTGGLGDKLALELQSLAAWWDRFATYEVGDVRPVQGGEVLSSAEQVATALRHWRERGHAAADLAFWRQHIEDFHSPKAFALVIDALLRREDYRASLGLMMSWLGQATGASLEDSDHSFHALALRWMLGVCRLAREQSAEAWELAVRFCDQLEANAEDYWHVPRLDSPGADEAEEVEEEEEEELFGAAYEGVTYEDSTDDDVESEVLEVGPQRDFDLDEESKRLDHRLRFLVTVARLWNIASRLTRSPLGGVANPKAASVLGQWLQRARHNYQGLLALLDAVHEHPVPEPSGATDSVVEYDRRRELKDRLTHGIIATCMQAALAVGALQGRLRGLLEELGEDDGTARVASGGPRWEGCVLRLEQALWSGDAAEAARLVPEFIALFEGEPLLYVSPANGGQPRQVLRAAIAQTILQMLAANLPRVGLLRETCQILRAAHRMEQAQTLQGDRVTEFARLLRIGLQSAVEAVVESALGEAGEHQIVGLLDKLINPFISLWNEHSQTFRVAMLETVWTDAEWSALQDFIRRYGRDLFHVRFMTFGNLRGILHRGVGAYLHDLEDEPDPLHPVRLVEDLDRTIPRAEAEQRLHLILRVLLENYEEYKDYNTTSPHSDYGENLYILFDFLRLKARYERISWRLWPLAQVHEVLARYRCSAAEVWCEQFTRLTRSQAEQQLKRLAELEQTHGIRLRTVADRLHERFVRPLALDRLCALVQPTVEAAGKPEALDALAQLEAELQPHLDSPTGVGLGVPHWLQRLEATVQQVQNGRTAIATLAEDLFKIPRVVAPLDELRRQLDEWSRQP